MELQEFRIATDGLVLYERHIQIDKDDIVTSDLLACPSVIAGKEAGPRSTWNDGTPIKVGDSAGQR